MAHTRKEVSTMTKKEMFTAIRNEVIDNAEMVAFIDHELELLNRKSETPRKPTQTQIENDGYKADILVALSGADVPVTIKELCELCETISTLSNQRITHLLTDLRKSGKVVRTYVKKVPYFALGNENEGE